MQLYFFALLLPEALNAQILPVKEGLWDRFGCRVGLRSPAHITLVPPFRMHPTLEENLQADAEAFARGRAPISLRAAGFATFGKRTLFIDVQPNESLQQLKRDCDSWFSAHHRYGMSFDRRPFHPHITLATRDLPANAFADAWAYVNTFRFDESWTADAVTLLKHRGQGWDQFRSFPFGNRESSRPHP